MGMQWAGVLCFKKKIMKSGNQWIAFQRQCPGPSGSHIAKQEGKVFPGQITVRRDRG